MRGFIRSKLTHCPKVRLAIFLTKADVKDGPVKAHLIQEDGLSRKGR